MILGKVNFLNRFLKLFEFLGSIEFRVQFLDTEGCDFRKSQLFLNF